MSQYTTIIEMLRQMNGALLPISGGRFAVIDDTTVTLPVRYGYHVDVEYVRARDTYTVRRRFQRGLSCSIKREWHDVHAAELADIAYTASCYHD